MTPYAEKLMIKKLEKWQEEGHDIGELINETILKGWQDPKWVIERKKHGKQKAGETDVSYFLPDVGEGEPNGEPN